MQKLTPFQTEIIAMALLQEILKQRNDWLHNGTADHQLFASFASALSRQHLSAARSLFHRHAGHPY